MKIKSNVEFSYNELTKAYVFDFDKMQKKKVGKVTSRMFPILLGKNKFQGLGTAILDRVGFLEKEDIEPWYKVRGDLGEHLANIYLKEMFRKYMGVEIVSKNFRTTDFPSFDMFHKHEKFGGVVDIGISSPEEYRSVVEVKSKNIKDYDFEKKRIKYENEEEVYQGEMLAVMSKAPTLYMAWVFFTDKQEDEIKKQTELIVANNKLNDYNVERLANHLGLTVENVTVDVRKFKVDKERVERDMEKAYDTLHRIIGLGYITDIHFTPSERAELDEELRVRSGVPYDPEDDRPF